MLQQNTKTPAMVLQEVAVKMGYSTPEYDLVGSKTGTHETEFHYLVKIANIKAMGFGRSKQVAKHEAATKALEMLAAEGKYDPRSNPVQRFNAQAHRNESDSPMKPQVNFIGTLQDLCNENKLPAPLFNQISDVGPSHCRVFTYECKLGPLTVQSFANTKKQAKQLAAKEMIDKVLEVLPELSKHFSAIENAITEREEEVISKHAECILNLGIIPNRAVAVADFSLCLRNIMDEKGLTIEDFDHLFKEQTKENLYEICDKLEIKYQVSELQENPYMVQINFGVETPLTVIEMGSSKENAFDNLIKSTYKVFNVYMNVTDSTIL